MASEFELVAALIGKDRFFAEVDEWKIGDLLKDILRLCHDLNDESYSAPYLASLIASYIGGWVTSGTGSLPDWPEEEGSGLETWNAEDSEAKPVLKAVKSLAE